MVKYSRLGGDVVGVVCCRVVDGDDYVLVLGLLEIVDC